MPRRKSTSASRLPFWLGSIAVAALLVFAGGELWSYLTSDPGRLLLARTLHVGDRAHVTRIVGKRIRAGLDQAAVRPDSIRESVVEADGGSIVRWRVGLPREGAPMQVNFAVTRALEECGAQVLSGKERSEQGGAQRVTLRAGLGGRVTHEIVIARAGRPVAEPGETENPEEPAPRLALLLYGFTEDAVDLAKEAAKRTEVFSLALPAGQDQSHALFQAARAARREVVVQLPMEPENYPRVTPGPGALLVSMPAGRIQSLTRKYLEQAGGAVAASNLMGSLASQDEPLMDAVYRELKKSGITFLHVQPSPRSVCRSLASQQGVAYDEPDVLLDDAARKKDTRALDKAWKDALESAAEHGRLMVMLRATPLSMKWLDAALEPKRLGRVRLVPLSDVIRRPGAV